MEEFFYYKVLIPVPTCDILSYKSTNEFSVGDRVLVPVRSRQITGIIFEIIEKPNFECKEILHKYNDPKPLFSKEYIQFLIQMSNYYVNPLGLVLEGVTSEKVLNSEIIPIESIEENPTIKKEDIILTEKQQEIYESINIEGYSCNLIHGITGSGKTEIYQKLASDVIEKGKQVLYIVPEISLTPQLIDRLAIRLGFIPTIYHSKLTKKQREHNFLSFSYNISKFMIGARSALFVPAQNIGLIIVDEEHESTYKQDNAPSYHLRDMAVLYASILKIPIILGSATPSVESMYNARIGKYNYFELLERPNNATLPTIKIIDMKNTDLYGGLITEEIYTELSNVVNKNEQAIIFLNRKGYSTYLYCEECGQVATCKNCSVSLVSFKSKKACSCRYCDTDYHKLVCSNCGSVNFSEYGAGTEKIEEFLEDLFPGKVLRIDNESMKSVKALSTTIKKFENKEANILVGTQLVAKGLHFPSVTFVGILGIDNILAIPDFRSYEKAYQLLIQVSGRAGRENLAGKVYIQTMNPENPVCQFLTNSDIDFYDWELSRREHAMYPPYSKLARLIFSHTKEFDTLNVAKIVYNNLNKTFFSNENIMFYYPKEAPIAKLINKFRFEILIKSESNKLLNNALYFALNVFEKNKKGAMIMKVDKDPYYLI